jgi:hypothetical protein
MSIVLTASVLFPDAIDEKAILWIVGGCGAAAALLTLGVWLVDGRRPAARRVSTIDALLRETWRMPTLAKLEPASLSTLSRVWMAALRAYLVLAAGLVLARIVVLAIGAS